MLTKNEPDPNISLLDKFSSVMYKFDLKWAVHFSEESNLIYAFFLKVSIWFFKGGDRWTDTLYNLDHDH